MVCLKTFPQQRKIQILPFLTVRGHKAQTGIQSIKKIISKYEWYKKQLKLKFLK